MRRGSSPAACPSPGRTSFADKLPPGLDGLKIALLADFHYRPDQDEELMDRVVARVCGEKPDLVALAGDFMSSDPGVLAPLLRKLGKLNAAHGVFAVMGNHDGWNPVIAMSSGGRLKKPAFRFSATITAGSRSVVNRWRWPARISSGAASRTPRARSGESPRTPRFWHWFTNRITSMS